MNILFTAFPVAAVVFLKQHVHHNQLGDTGGDGTELERAFVGTAAQHHVSQLCRRGFVEPGDQNGGNFPGLCELQYLQTVGGGTGIGEQDDRILFAAEIWAWESGTA